MNEKDYCVLLTPCINPIGALLLKRNDYIISLSNWLKHNKTKIVFL